MDNHKRPWQSPQVLAQPEQDMSRKDRRALEADVRYWKDSSKRKDQDIKYKDNQIRGLKSHITRLQATLHKKGVYKS